MMGRKQTARSVSFFFSTTWHNISIEQDLFSAIDPNNKI